MGYQKYEKRRKIGYPGRLLKKVKQSKGEKNGEEIEKDSKFIDVTAKSKETLVLLLIVIIIISINLGLRLGGFLRRRGGGVFVRKEEEKIGRAHV